MRFSTKIEGIPRNDKIRCTAIIKQINIKPIETIMREEELGGLGSIQRMKYERITVEKRKMRRS